MKNLTLLATLLFSCYCQAQNYQCFFKQASKNFFLNGNGYLRGMRIDSVRTNGSDTIYYPYHTPRGAYGCGAPSFSQPLNTDGGSWLGKKVLQQPNGTFLFDNIWNDTVIIRTQAVLGESWPFFNDTTQIAYYATVTDIGTMTVLGTLDSVKTITISADSGGSVNALDPVNNFKLILSKNHGFVQVFDLYTFPYHRPDSIFSHNQFYDYYLDLVLDNVRTADLTCFVWNTNPPDTSNSIFRLFDFYNPTRKEIYNFSAGDVFEFNDYRYLYSAGYESEMILDSVNTSTTAPYSIISSGIERRNKIAMQPVGGTLTYNTTDYRGPYSSGGDTARLLNLEKMPEEWGSSSFYHYLPSASLGNTSCSAAVYTFNAENISYPAGIVRFYPTDFNLNISSSSISYAIGYGEIASDEYPGGLNFYRNKRLTYVLKGGVSCGAYTHVPVAIQNIDMPVVTASIFPNPAIDALHLSSSALVSSLSITNLQGQILHFSMPNSNTADIDIRYLLPGIYLIRINGAEVRRFIKQ